MSVLVIHKGVMLSDDGCQWPSQILMLCTISCSAGGDFGDSLEWNSAQVYSTWSHSCLIKLNLFVLGGGDTFLNKVDDKEATSIEFLFLVFSPEIDF